MAQYVLSLFERLDRGAVYRTVLDLISDIFSSILTRVYLRSWDYFGHRRRVTISKRISRMTPGGDRSSKPDLFYWNLYSVILCAYGCGYLEASPVQLCATLLDELVLALVHRSL
jgi:hypothetical protein